VTILVPCLLAATVYYSSFLSLNTIFPKSAYAFSWCQGNTYSTDTDYANSTLLSYNLGAKFQLKNGTEIHINNPWDSATDFAEYNGSIAFPLENIGVFLTNGYHLEGTVGVVGGVNITMGGPSVTYPIANLTLTENTTLSTLLVTTTVQDMGNYSISLGLGTFDATNTPGYWPNASNLTTNAPEWKISSTELMKYLTGSGNATVRFNGSFNVHVGYTITYSDNTTQTGEKDLAWNGTIGTVMVSYDDNGVQGASYEWSQIKLVLLALKNPT
jgi:hypothetical protein